MTIASNFYILMNLWIAGRIIELSWGKFFEPNTPQKHFQQNGSKNWMIYWFRLNYCPTVHQIKEMSKDSLSMARFQNWLFFVRWVNILFSLARSIITFLIFKIQLGCGRDELIETSNNHPYMIAYGESKKNITNYFIDVERHIMNVNIVREENMFSCY